MAVNSMYTASAAIIIAIEIRNRNILQRHLAYLYDNLILNDNIFRVKYAEIDSTMKIPSLWVFLAKMIFDGSKMSMEPI